MAANLDPAVLLRAYAMGVFPMAESREDPEIHWIDPRRRGVFPLQGFHISRSLARLIRRWEVQVRVNTAFEAVVDACAARDETWINAPIRTAYQELHQMGHAHSLEVWAGDQLAGGVYGVTLGAGFFGESMFSAQTGGSKVALAYLIHRLQAGGFQLFDTQFLTPHLASLGAVEIPRAAYHRLLESAVKGEACFEPKGYCPSASSVLSGLSVASGGA